MKTKVLLFALIVAGLSSCSTSARFAQTPDDVYYSPVPVRNDYVQVNNEEERNGYNNSSEDREISRRINNRKWRRYHSYDYGYGTVYAPYGYYDPYGYNNYPVYVDPKTGKSVPAYKAPRKYNLGTYTQPSVTYKTDPKSGKVFTVPNTTNNAGSRAFNRSQNGSGVGNFIRKVFTPSNTISDTYNNNNNISQSRTFESRSSNSSSSSSSSSSGSSSAPVRSFRK